MAYVQADLVREVLEELLKLQPGETVPDEDTTAVTTRIEATLAELAVRNVYYMADATEIPPEAFNPLVTYMAEVCAPKYGRARDRDAMRDAEDALRTLARIGKGTGAKLKTDPALNPRRYSAFNFARGT
jgi:hypothetical protein